MCGIFGYIGESFDAPKITFAGIKDLEYRGYDSWGVAFLDQEGIGVIKKAGKIGDAKIGNPKSQIAIAHTRWATHGGVTDQNAHPHTSCTNSIALIHNGIFENHLQFKKMLGKNHKFTSQTDTEVAAHLIEKYLSLMSFEDAFSKVFSEMLGMNALVAIDAKGEKILAAKKGSPLVLGFGENQNFIASDSQALLHHTDQVYFLKDMEMAEITMQKIRVRDVTGDKFKSIKRLKIAKVYKAETKGKYKSFMLKEINEQPAFILNAAKSKPNQNVQSNIRSHEQNYLIGCGSAYYAALAGQYLFSKVGINANAIQASEFCYLKPFINKNSNIIAISQSGETMDLLETVNFLKSKQVNVDSITNVYGASLYRASDNSILLNAGREKAVASTKALTLMIANLIKLVLPNYKNILKNVSRNSKEIINSPDILTVAKALADSKGIFVIGRGPNYVAALETALKIKEISYIHAEAFAAGELKHGPLALIEKDTPVILFIPNDETKPEMMIAAHEIKARGGKVIAVSENKSKIFDYFIKVKYSDEGTIICNIIVGQLIAYYITVIKKLDADMPRNLAKSVTVK